MKYDYFAHLLVGRCPIGLPPLLGHQPVCAAADNKNRAGRLRGCDCALPDLFVFATGRGPLGALNEMVTDPLCYQRDII